MRIVHSAIPLLLMVPVSAQTLLFASRLQPAGIPEYGGTTGVLATADVDADGDFDLLLGRHSDVDGLALRLLLNDGRGAFTDVSTTQLPSASPVPNALHVFDADGDGDMDLLLAGNGNPLTPPAGNRLYQNDGSGNFSDVTAGRLPAAVDPTSSFSTGDIDGDGDADIVLGSALLSVPLFGATGLQSLLYTNDGTGTFSDATAARLPVNVDQTDEVLLFDADLDGDLDLLLSNSPPNQFQTELGQDRLYANDGTGHFSDQTATMLPFDNDTATDVAALDVDVDGDLDLVRIGLFGGDRTMLQNDGAGHFVDVTASLAPDLTAGTALSVGDFDDDGRADVFVALGSQNRLLLNDGFGGLVDATDQLPGDVDFSRDAVAADFDGNGTTDIATGSVGFTWSRDRLYLQRGGGEFDLVPRYEIIASNILADALVAGDVDGDGDADLIFGDSRNPNVLLLGDGDGDFERASDAAFPPLQGRTRALTLGDVNDDGHVDLWAGNGSNLLTQDQLMLGDGAGNFTDVTATHVPTSSDRAFAVVFGDVDDDGDLDLFTGLGQHNPTANRLLRNDGMGRFTFDLAAIPQVLGRTRSAVMVDLDGDDDLDIAWADLENNAILINDGLGNFTDETNARYPALPLRAGQHIVAADIDDDGDQDLFFAAHSGNRANRLFVNDGFGVFTDVSATQLPPDRVGIAARFGDVDDDGDPDIVLGYVGAALFLNDGLGQFTDASASLEADDDITRSIVLADVDLDQDLDVILGRYMIPGSAPDIGRHRLLHNHTRQWQATNFPLLGLPYDVQLTTFGQTGVLAAPFLDFLPLTPRLSVFELGLLGLPPNTLIGLPGLVTDANGEATLSLTIANVPAALGLTLYTQSLVVPTPAPDTWRFTNREASKVR